MCQFIPSHRISLLLRSCEFGIFLLWARFVLRGNWCEFKDPYEVRILWRIHPFLFYCISFKDESIRTRENIFGERKFGQSLVRRKNSCSGIQLDYILIFGYISASYDAFLMYTSYVRKKLVHSHNFFEAISRGRKCKNWFSLVSGRRKNENSINLHFHIFYIKNSVDRCGKIYKS